MHVHVGSLTSRSLSLPTSLHSLPPSLPPSPPFLPPLCTCSTTYSTLLHPVSSVHRVVLCSGKHYYLLDSQRRERGVRDTALVRVELLAPFPAGFLQQHLSRYPNATGTGTCICTCTCICILCFVLEVNCMWLKSCAFSQNFGGVTQMLNFYRT